MLLKKTNKQQQKNTPSKQHIFCALVKTRNLEACGFNRSPTYAFLPLMIAPLPPASPLQKPTLACDQLSHTYTMMSQKHVLYLSWHPWQPCWWLRRIQSCCAGRSPQTPAHWWLEEGALGDGALEHCSTRILRNIYFTSSVSLALLITSVFLSSGKETAMA